MTSVLAALAVIAAGLGALARYGLTQYADRRASGPQVLPWGTVLANTCGSFVAGAVLAAVMIADAPVGWLLVLGGGFAGGLSTFSTLAVDVLMVWRSSRVRGTLTYVGATFATGLAAAAAGWALIALAA